MQNKTESTTVSSSSSIATASVTRPVVYTSIKPLQRSGLTRMHTPQKYGSLAKVGHLPVDPSSIGAASCEELASPRASPTANWTADIRRAVEREVSSLSSPEDRPPRDCWTRSARFWAASLRLRKGH